MKTTQDRRATLLKRLSELDSRLHAIEAELDQPHTKDWDDMAIETEGDQVLERLGQSGLDEVRRTPHPQVVQGLLDGEAQQPHRGARCHSRVG